MADPGRKQKLSAIILNSRQPNNGQSETVARVIGRIPDFTADGQWHHAEFDLLGAIKTAYGGRVPGDVQSVSFATPRGSYLWCGFGGNPWGTTLNLDNFYLGGYPKGAAAGS